jgi:hypothetical protein
MITTKIDVPSHLCEYVCGKFADMDSNSPVRFPDETDLYHLLYDLLEKRPAGCYVDRGNLEIILPERSMGKNTSTYNYLGQRSQRIIIRKLEVMMWAEAHEYIDTSKHRHGIDYIDSVHTFMTKYGIRSISEDAFVKNYYRWRDKCRKREKRDYRRKKVS